MIQAANMILKEGIIKLSTVFKAVFPNVSYRSSNAKRRLFRMPLVAIFINKEQYIMEKTDGFNYMSLITFFETKSSKNLCMNKNDLKNLLLMVKGDKERECVRYAIYKCSGLTQTQARNHFGLENMEARALAVESCVREVKDITSELESIVTAQCQALSECYGLITDEKDFSLSDIAESDYSDSDDNLVDNPEELSLLIPQHLAENDDMLMKILFDSDYNWFEFVERLERQNYSLDLLDKFFLDLPHKNLSKEALQAVVQSHRAYVAIACDMAVGHRAARSINGEVVTESESELELDECASKEVKCLVIRKQASIME
jgi:hypothetical protein